MLRDLQKAFLEKFYASKNTAEFLQFINSTEQLTSQERFAIYQGSIVEGLVKALQESFPVTQKIVGEEFFRMMAIQYIATMHSKSPNLGNYGRHFAQFVAQFPAAKCLPYLSDVSKLEWYWQEAYYGEDYSPLNIDQLKQISTDQHCSLIFKRCVNSSLLQSNYPLKKIWEFNQKSEAGELLFEQQENYMLIWRPRMEVEIEPLTIAQWLVLKGFNESLTLGQLTEKLPPEISLSVEIKEMFTRGWFSSFEIGGSE